MLVWNGTEWQQQLKSHFVQTEVVGGIAEQV